jgi:predicted Zn-dependent protease
MIYASEKRYEETLSFFKLALAANNCAETNYLVGTAYLELERPKTALRYLQKAVESDVKFADAWYMLGSVYLRLDDEKGAKEALSMALAARDSTSQCQLILKNPKKYAEITQTSLLFARLAHVRKNLVSGSSPRLAKLLREEIEKLMNG